MLSRSTLWILLCLPLWCGMAAAGQPVAETRQFIAADSSRQRAALIGEDGQTIWEQKIGPLHDLHVLPGGNILMQLFSKLHSFKLKHLLIESNDLLIFSL